MPPAVTTRHFEEIQIAKQRILALLEEHRQGKTYQAIAEELGISRPHLCLMGLRHEYVPGTDVLAALALWNKDFEPLVLDYLKAHARGKLKKRTQLTS